MLRKLLEFLKSKFNKFRENTPEYIAITITFWAFFVVMIILAIMRLFGFGYWHIDYEEQEYNEVIATIIMFCLKLFDVFFILLTLTKIKVWLNIIISVAYVTIVYLIDIPLVETIADFAYIILVPLIFNRKYLLKSLISSAIYIALVLAYQFLMAFARYEIDFTAKYNYIMQVVSVIDYKTFIFTIFLYSKRRHIKWKKKHELTDPKLTKQDNSGAEDVSSSGATTPHSTKQ